MLGRWPLGLEWTNSHQCTSWGWARSTHFGDEHPPCPSGFFFSPPLCPEILYLPPTSPFLPSSLLSPLLPPPSYLPPTYHLPSPSSLPPSNPTPPHSITRALETSSGWSWSWSTGARAVVVERELERLEPEQDPCIHETHAPTRR